VIQTGNGVGTRPFGQVNTQLLGTAAPENRLGQSNIAPAAAAQHFSSLGIGGQSPLVDAIAVMLYDQLRCLAIDADQEVTGWV
jgi:hypothetical protein